MLSATVAVAQHATGALHLQVQTQDGSPVDAVVTLRGLEIPVERTQHFSGSQGAQFTQLRFGAYKLRVEAPGFSPHGQVVRITSEVPQTLQVTLQIAVPATVVDVNSAEPAHPAVRHVISRERLETASGVPARGLADLVRTQPGWLLEAHGVLHPRGSEYDTQVILDGIPITDNRSMAFAPAFAPQEFESIAVLTSGYPAEYGRKLGGVIEAMTGSGTNPGLSGEVGVAGGNFAHAVGGFKLGYARPTWSARLSGTASHTSRYLDPPTFENLNNHGRHHAVAVIADKTFGGTDILRGLFRFGRTSFDVPNDPVQHEAGQRQGRSGTEFLGQLSHQHTFGANTLLASRFAARDVAATLDSNEFATPIIAGQDRGFREIYFGSSVAHRQQRHEIKFGFDVVSTRLREAFAYEITDADDFDDDVPLAFAFSRSERGIESGVYVQDRFTAGSVVISAGVRYDHYSVLTKRHAISPRISAAWNIPGSGFALRGSYDRAFQTPAIENLLLASSTVTQNLTPEAEALPIPPSTGDFWEAGFTHSLWNRGRLDVAAFRRNIRNFADDDVFLNTGISFPVSFARAEIHGYEAKLDLPRLGRAGVSISYSNLVGTGILPLTGGLFLEEEAREQLHSRESFRISQDQRNTVAGLFSFAATDSLWFAVRPLFGSGLPVELEGDLDADDLAETDPRILRRVNLAEGRLRQNWQVDFLSAWDFWREDRRSASLQLQVENLTNRQNVINFAGLLSSNAVGQTRAVRVRLTTRF